MKWMECVKSVKNLIASQNPSYSQSGYMYININNKRIKVRRDCSGYVSAVLDAMGIFPNGFVTNSTGFSHDNTVASYLKKAGFTKKAFANWNALTEGCIISDDYSHVEIFSHNNGNKHYVYSNGSTSSMRSKVATTESGNHKYDTVWFPPVEKKELDLKSGVWYKALDFIPLRNGYYGEVGNYEYLSELMKRACVEMGGKAYIPTGNIICPTETKVYTDGSAWIKLDATMAAMVRDTSGNWLIEKA